LLKPALRAINWLLAGSMYAFFYMARYNFTAINAYLERVKTGTISNDELEKARASAQRAFVSTMGSSLGRAINLSQSAIFYNDPGRFATNPERIAKVTAADVQRVATKYFTPANRVVVVTTPKGVKP